MSTNIGSRLRRLRKLRGLGLRQLAKKTQIEPATISRIENQQTKTLATATLRRLARALDVSVDELVIGPLSDETVMCGCGLPAHGVCP